MYLNKSLGRSLDQQRTHHRRCNPLKTKKSQKVCDFGKFDRETSISSSRLYSKEIVIAATKTIVKRSTNKIFLLKVERTTGGTCSRVRGVGVKEYYED